MKEITKVKLGINKDAVVVVSSEVEMRNNSTTASTVPMTRIPRIT